MMNFVARLLTRSEPAISEVTKNDVAAITAVHAASFRRGWSEDEFRRMLADPNVLAHRTMIGRTLIGFIVSRLIADEAEILSVAIDEAWRGRGFSRPLLDLHLRRLAGLGARTVFLEVDKKMRRPAGSTGAPDSTKLGSAKAIMTAAPRR